MNHWPQLSCSLEGAEIVAISLGAGLQSSTLALMAGRGDLGRVPDVAFFADTGGERRVTYEYLDWLQGQVPFPIVRARRPGPTLEEASLSVMSGGDRKGVSLPPFYLVDQRGNRSMMPKQCSKEYKTRVVQRAVRAMLAERGIVRPRRPIVEMMIGMSRDEMLRVKRSETPWIHNRHPLVEMNMRRSDCRTWLEQRQYRVPPKSSCRYCPFRDNVAWQRLAAEDPDEFDLVVEFDEAIRSGWHGMDGQAFVHRSGKPLRDAVLTADDPELPLGADCDACGS